MKIVTFWTLNPNLPPSKIAQVVAMLMQKGLFPVKGVKDVLGFYVTAEYRLSVIVCAQEGTESVESFIIGFC